MAKFDEYAYSYIYICVCVYLYIRTRTRLSQCVGFRVVSKGAILDCFEACVYMRGMREYIVDTGRTDLPLICGASFCMCVYSCRVERRVHLVVVVVLPLEAFLFTVALLNIPQVENQLGRPSERHPLLLLLCSSLYIYTFFVFVARY